MVTLTRSLDFCNFYIPRLRSFLFVSPKISSNGDEFGRFIEMAGMPRVIYSIAHRVVKCICLLIMVQQEQCMLSTYILFMGWTWNTASTHVDKTHMKQKCLIVQVHCDNKLCIVIYMHTQTCPYIQYGCLLIINIKGF